jgi:RNA polymerase primary sigma factor/RNA polymerase sporulation-specific sigma factor
MTNESPLMNNEHLCLLAKQGDFSAQDTLIKNFISSMELDAAALKKKYSGLQVEAEDLLQEALIGFLRAIQTYRQKEGIQFQTYASAVTQHAMLDYIRKCKSDIPESGPIISLDNTPPGLDTTSVTYVDILINEYAASPEQLYIKKETILEVREVLWMISDREREYLFFRYGFIDDVEHDRTETAFHFHLSVSRAKSLEVAGLRHCKRQLLK